MPVNAPPVKPVAAVMIVPDTVVPANDPPTNVAPENAGPEKPEAAVKVVPDTVVPTNDPPVNVGPENPEAAM